MLEMVLLNPPVLRDRFPADGIARARRRRRRRPIGERQRRWRGRRRADAMTAPLAAAAALTPTARGSARAGTCRTDMARDSACVPTPLAPLSKRRPTKSRSGHRVAARARARRARARPVRPRRRGARALAPLATGADGLPGADVERRARRRARRRACPPRPPRPPARPARSAPPSRARWRPRTAMPSAPARSRLPPTTTPARARTAWATTRPSRSTGRSASSCARWPSGRSPTRTPSRRTRACTTASSPAAPAQVQQKRARLLDESEEVDRRRAPSRRAARSPRLLPPARRAGPSGGPAGHRPMPRAHRRGRGRRQRALCVRPRAPPQGPLPPRRRRAPKDGRRGRVRHALRHPRNRHRPGDARDALTARRRDGLVRTPSRGWRPPTGSSPSPRSAARASATRARPRARRSVAAHRAPRRGDRGAPRGGITHDLGARQAAGRAAARPPLGAAISALAPVFRATAPQSVCPELSAPSLCETADRREYRGI